MFNKTNCKNDYQNKKRYWLEHLTFKKLRSLIYFKILSKILRSNISSNHSLLNSG